MNLLLFALLNIVTFPIYLIGYLWQLLHIAFKRGCGRSNAEFTLLYCEYYGIEVVVQKAEDKKPE